MPNSNVGKRVIRAAGKDGYTWVTYRHPERAHVGVWIRQGDVKPGQKYALRDRSVCPSSIETTASRKLN